MRVLIAGGGVGGLAAAIGLADQGFEPVVLEKAPALEQVGAGIALSPNGLKALRYLGCIDHIHRTGTHLEGGKTLEFETGRPITQMIHGALGRARYGERYVTIHRADVQDALLARVPDGAVRLDARVVGFEENPGGVAVTLGDGSQVEGDLLIGADGLKSPVREQMFGLPEPRYAGLVGWRAVIAADEVPSVPVSRWSTAWWGRPGNLLVYPVLSNTAFNFVAWLFADDSVRESWSLTGSGDELRRLLAGSGDEHLQMLVNAIPQALLTAIYFRDPLVSWGDGRVTLLGDAAHPAIPYTGNGASMALEDAVTLAKVLGRHDRSTISQALVEYGHRRIPRTTRLQTLGRLNIAMWAEKDPRRLASTHAAVRALSRLDPTGLVAWDWVYGHDAVDAADLPVAELLADEPNPLERPEARRAFEAYRNALGPEEHAGGLLGQRAGYERFLLAEAPPGADTRVEPLTLGGVACLRVGEGGPTAALHLFGGGFGLGSARATVEFAARLSRALCAPVVIPEYRHPPEAPHPAALDDALAVYRALLTNDPVLVTGEDAGGGLALSLAIALREAGEPQPKGLYLISPWADLRLVSPSVDSAIEPILTRAFLMNLAAAYLQDASVDSPLASPLAGDLGGLAPMLIHAAEGEMLRDDAARIAEAADDAQLRLFPDTVHSFVLFPYLPEAEEALQELASWADALSGARLST